MNNNFFCHLNKKIEHLVIYYPFFVCKIKENFAYKISSILQIISRILGVVVTYYLWKAIYDNSEMHTINGFSFPQMVEYIVVSYITTNIVQIGVAFDMGKEVQDGSIVINLLRPINYKMKMLMSSFATMLYRLIFPSSLMILIFESFVYFKYGTFYLTLNNIVFYFISVSASFMIYFLFDFCIGILSFYTTYIWGITIAKNAILKILTGQLIPLVFFSKIIVRVFEFFPFMSMNYIPVMIFCGKLQHKDMLISILKQFIWIIVILLVSKVLWKHATKKLMIYGG